MSRDAHAGGEHGVPRWPAAAAMFAISAIYAFVSERLTVGPPGLLLVLVVALLVPLALARRHGRYRLERRIRFAIVLLATLAVGASTILLVIVLPGQTVAAPTLLQGAALLWVANVLAFALWYWEIDGGGPERRRPDGHSSVDFLFPQLMGNSLSGAGWSPGFVDYLFLAFTTSTAFSPTDTMVLSRRAKMLMMVQSLISLVVVVALAARAVNTL